MSGLDELFSVDDFGAFIRGSPSVDPALLDALLICCRKISPPFRNLCRSAQEGANEGNQELLPIFLGLSPCGAVGSSVGMLTRTSLRSITDVGTDVGSSCCHTGELQSSLSCLSNCMIVSTSLVVFVV